MEPKPLFGFFIPFFIVASTIIIIVLVLLWEKLKNLLMKVPLINKSCKLLWAEFTGEESEPQQKIPIYIDPQTIALYPQLVTRAELEQEAQEKKTKSEANEAE